METTTMFRFIIIALTIQFKFALSVRHSQQLIRWIIAYDSNLFENEFGCAISNGLFFSLISQLFVFIFIFFFGLGPNGALIIPYYHIDRFVLITSDQLEIRSTPIKWNEWFNLCNCQIYCDFPTKKTMAHNALGRHQFMPFYKWSAQFHMEWMLVVPVQLPGILSAFHLSIWMRSIHFEIAALLSFYQLLCSLQFSYCITALNHTNNFTGSHSAISRASFFFTHFRSVHLSSNQSSMHLEWKRIPMKWTQYSPFTYKCGTWLAPCIP